MLRQTLLGIASETFSCVCTPVQHASRLGYGNPINQEVADQVKFSKIVLDVLGNWAARYLRSNANNIIKVASPSGGFYLYPVWVADKTSKNSRLSQPDFFSLLLKETGVALLHGDAFVDESLGLDNRQEYECLYHARLSFVDFDGKSVLDQIKEDLGKDLDVEDEASIELWIKKYTPNIFDGITKICEWTKRNQDALF